MFSMGDRLRTMGFGVWLQAQLSPLTLMGLWIAVVSGLQEMMVEDFEFYAVYESSYSDLALSFLTFKPVEYLCEVVAVFAVIHGRSLVSAGVKSLWTTRRHLPTAI